MVLYNLYTSLQLFLNSYVNMHYMGIGHYKCSSKLPSL